MKIDIEIPDYSSEDGMKIVWEDGFVIESAVADNSVVIRANAAGLVSLARQLLTLAQETVPTGNHIHYDDLNSLEDGSCEIVIEKI